VTASPARPPIRDRPSDPWPVGERSLIGTVLGIPPIAAVGSAFGFTALGVFVDLQRVGTVGMVFRILYFTGCVLAVAWVRRRNLFAPVVQPPLLLAVAIPVIVLLSDGANLGTGLTETLLAVGAPLVNSFPTMAVTTGVVLALGLARLVLQREPPDRERRRRNPPGTGGQRRTTPSDSDAARAAARRPATPPRS
jgi:hypothetical protein